MMKQFYRNEAVVYWGLLIIAALLMFLDSFNQGAIPPEVQKQQTINCAPVEELFLLHA
jgi:hypothetical protein